MQEKSSCQDIKNKYKKKSFFYRCDDKSCKNAFINWCKHINDIKLIIEEEEGVNEIDQITNEMKRTKDELLSLD